MALLSFLLSMWSIGFIYQQGHLTDFWYQQWPFPRWLSDLLLFWLSSWSFAFSYIVIFIIIGFTKPRGRRYGCKSSCTQGVWEKDTGFWSTSVLSIYMFVDTSYLCLFRFSTYCFKIIFQLFFFCPNLFPELLTLVIYSKCHSLAHELLYVR